MKFQLAQNLELDPMTPATAKMAAGRLALMSPWSELGYTAEGLETYFLREDPALHRFSVRYCGRTAGIFCVREKFLRGSLLELIAILPEVQGHGVGRLLLKSMEGPEPAVHNLWTLVSDFNEPAILFYEKCGFTRTASIGDLVSVGKSEILMRKILRKVK